ncbi:MAG: beta-ACP synthase [Flavobacteriales bacterium]|nr:MAG: beta-ACP synthase [Flavobacteriales bacterium]PIE48994.1 MAG: beta-ACP synthase [Flavobacteriales bacterium]
MSKGVAITGMGIISAIGNNVAENYQSLKNSKHGLGTVEQLNTIHENVIKVGEIGLSNEVLAKKLNLPQTHNYSRTALLGSIAAKEAFSNADVDLNDGFQTGLVSATSVGGMDMTEKFYYQYLTDPTNRRFITSHPAGDSSEKIARQLDISGYVTTISTACSSAANAIMLGARLINSGRLDRVVAGGSDCLSKFTINGFKTLMILSEEYCKPFDEERSGLNLGEAAAYLVLESEKIVKSQKKKVLAYVSGYGNANDAYHQTASSEEGIGATLAMQKALQISGLSPKNIDYINAHGTATPNNDLSESKAIHNVFGKNIPPVSSTKAFTGHTLSAAGGIEAVYSVLSLQHQEIFPNLNFKKVIEETGIVPVTAITKKNMNHILSNSFGFGGNCTALIFSKN